VATLHADAGLFMRMPDCSCGCLTLHAPVRTLHAPVRTVHADAGLFMQMPDSSCGCADSSCARADSSCDRRDFLPAMPRSVVNARMKCAAGGEAKIPTQPVFT
jgi:hypothetical protein